MCAPALALGIVSGVGGMLADRQAKMAEYRAKQAAVARSNALAQQDYLNKINLSSAKDQRKSQVFKAELQAAAASKTAMYKQLQINQQEADRAGTANQLKLQEKHTEAQLQTQQKLGESIRAQGSVLASGMSSGQSMLLALQDTERQLGFQQAAIDQSLFSAGQSYGMTQYGIELDKYSADSRTISSAKSGPLFTPQAENKTLKPIMQAGPSKPSMLGSIIGGITTGVKVGSGIGNADPSKPWWQ